MRVGVLIVLAAAIAFAAAPASSAPLKGGHNGLIAFSSELHSAEIYTANADGTAVRRLTDNPAASRWPALSPDGQTIAFCSKREDRSSTDDQGWDLYLMRGDRSEPTRITRTGQGGFAGYPDWSPDGTRVAFSMEMGDRLDIIVYDVVKGSFTDLTPDGSSDQHPRWSP